MKKQDIIIVILALLLLAGMVLTIFFGGEKSRHGVGSQEVFLPEISQGTVPLLADW